MSKMQTRYTFRSNSGDVIEVDAEGEAEARGLAMTELHGPAPQRIGVPSIEIGRGGWTGSGLSLVTREEDSNAM